MATISERARDFWDRISPRERRLVVILAFAVPAILALWLAMSIHSGLEAMEARNEKTRKALRVLDNIKASGGVVKPANDDVVSTMGTEPLSLDTYLSSAAQKAGFTLKGTTPRNPVTRNGFVTNTVSCDARGLTIDQLRKFLQEIETGSKVVMVTNLRISRQRTDKEKLDAQLEVSTYSKEATGNSEGSAHKKGT
jgi:general secretion pathway protein M